MLWMHITEVAKSMTSTAQDQTVPENERIIQFTKVQLLQYSLHRIEKNLKMEPPVIRAFSQKAISNSLSESSW